MLCWCCNDEAQPAEVISCEKLVTPDVGPSFTPTQELPVPDTGKSTPAISQPTSPANEPGHAQAASDATEELSEAAPSAAHETALAPTLDAATAAFAFVPAEPVEANWEVTLVKPSKKKDAHLGIGIRLARTHLVVETVNEGVVMSFNQANPDKAILAGSVIMEVNGCLGSSHAIHEALRKSHVLQMKLRYVSEFPIAVAEEGALGLDCRRNIVRHVKREGIVPSYNKSCGPGYEVHVGDQIVAIDGELVDPADLAAALNNRRASIILTIRRGGVCLPAVPKP